MSQTAKLFINGRSQAVRLPAAFRFDGSEVYIRQDEETGDIILSKKPDSWDEFFAMHQGLEVPENFLSETERKQSQQDRDPLAGL